MTGLRSQDSYILTLEKKAHLADCVDKIMLLPNISLILMECSQCTAVHICPKIKSQACLSFCLSDVSHYPSFVRKARLIHSLCINKPYHTSKELSHLSSFQSHSIFGAIYQKMRITINHLWDGSQSPMLPLIQFVSKQSILFSFFFLFFVKVFSSREKKYHALGSQTLQHVL